MLSNTTVEPDDTQADSAAAPAIAIARKRRDRERKFVYGNYVDYYGNSGRNLLSKGGSSGLQKDRRLQSLPSERFTKKDILDIGCNSGLLTATIARTFGVRSMLGAQNIGEQGHVRA